MKLLKASVIEELRAKATTADRSDVASKEADRLERLTRSEFRAEFRHAMRRTESPHRRAMRRTFRGIG